MAAKALSVYQSLVKTIKSGQIESIYLFHGSELILAQHLVTLLQEQLIPAGLDSLNINRLDGRKMNSADFLAAVQTPPMFAERRLVIVDQPFFLQANKDTPEAIGQLFADWPAYACLVLLSDQIDKRLKLVKQLLLHACSAEFPALSPREAADWVDSRLRRAGCRFQPGLGRQLVELTGADLARLRLEVDKLVAYAGESKVLQADDIEALVGQAVETSIFDLVDSIGQRNITSSLRLMTRMLESGQEPMYLLSMIIRQFRLLLKARSLLDQGLTRQQTATSLRIHPFAAGKLVEQAVQWQLTALKAALHHCLEADIAIKTGQLKGSRALDALLISLASLK